MGFAMYRYKWSLRRTAREVHVLGVDRAATMREYKEHLDELSSSVGNFLETTFGHGKSPKRENLS